jgi:hypothetical protein
MQVGQFACGSTKKTPAWWEIGQQRMCTSQCEGRRTFSWIQNVLRNAEGEESEDVGLLLTIEIDDSN